MENKTILSTFYEHCDYVSYIDYNILLNENRELRQQIASYQNKISILHTIIETRDKTIDELKKENEELKIRLTNLESENKKLQQTVLILTDDVKELKNNLFISKLINAIKEVIIFYKLIDKEQNDIFKTLLQEFSEERNNCQHYWRYKTSEDERNHKILLLKDKLINLSPCIKSYFNENYPDLIDIIIGNISCKMITCSNKYIDTYW